MSKLRKQAYETYEIDGVEVRRPAMDADKPMYFHIEDHHVKRAKPRCPKTCVIAQALTDALGVLFVKVEIGPYIAKMYLLDRCVRFKTPPVLRASLKVWDDIKVWNLPPGRYSLEVLPPKLRLGGRPNRWDQVPRTKTTPGRDSFRPSYVVPGRSISRISTRALDPKL